MIPLVDLKAQNRSLAEPLEAAFRRVLHSGQYVLGPEVEAFEQAFAAYCGTRHAIAVNTGTSALHLALLAAGIGHGDEVITTSMTFVATVAAIQYTGARPVLVDIDPRRRTLDPAAVAAAVGPRTRAIIPVHLHGCMADMDAIMAIAERHGLAVIEDAAQAHGAHAGSASAGAIGLAGCFSFYPGKNLGALGEGGAVVTNSDELQAKVRLLRDWGQRNKYDHVLKGYNYRLDGLQAALLAVKLDRLESWTDARRRHAHHYSVRLRGAGFGLPEEPADTRHVFHVYAIETEKRDAVRARLALGGVSTGIHYPVPVHLQQAYADLGYKAGDFPHSERFSASTLSLPLYPELSPSQVDQVADHLSNAPAMAAP